MSETKVGQDLRRFSKKFEWSGYALGIGLGGFFDGILLHQVLQWHHLLSGVENARYDIRMLIFWDGIFHTLMYVVSAIGLWLLWRVRGEFAETGADRRLLGNALVGFGAWHLLDSLLSHWLLGLHRIRMDVDNPLFWDLIWFAAFGVIPLIFGWLTRTGNLGSRRPIMSSPLALLLATMVAGPVTLLPPPDQTQVVTLFRPGVTEQEVFAAIMAVNGRFLGSDTSGQLWVIDMSDGGNPAHLYRYGAVMVSSTVLPLGCFDWTRA